MFLNLCIHHILSVRVCNHRDSKNLYEKMLLARKKIIKHGREQRLIKVQEVSKAAATARSNLHKKVRELRASAIESSLPTAIRSRQRVGMSSNKLATDGKKNLTALYSRISSTGHISQPRSGLSLRLSPVILSVCVSETCRRLKFVFLIKARFDNFVVSFYVLK